MKKDKTTQPTSVANRIIYECFLDIILLRINLNVSLPAIKIQVYSVTFPPIFKFPTMQHVYVFKDRLDIIAAVFNLSVSEIEHIFKIQLSSHFQPLSNIEVKIYIEICLNIEIKFNIKVRFNIAVNFNIEDSCNIEVKFNIEVRLIQHCSQFNIEDSCNIEVKFNIEIGFEIEHIDRGC